MVVKAHGSNNALREIDIDFAVDLSWKVVEAERICLEFYPVFL